MTHAIFFCDVCLRQMVIIERDVIDRIASGREHHRQTRHLTAIGQRRILTDQFDWRKSIALRQAHIATFRCLRCCRGRTKSSER